MIASQLGIIKADEVILSPHLFSQIPLKEALSQIQEMVEIARSSYMLEAQNKGLKFDSLEEFRSAELVAKRMDKIRLNRSYRNMPEWPKQPDGVGPNGRKFCRCGCGQEVGPRRSSWHSNECFKKIRAKHDWGFLRQEVFKRDDYTCRMCGSKDNGCECDHSIPMIQGGTHDMDNLRTLCVTCHKIETKRLREALKIGVKFVPSNNVN
jgi:hypothetical protein